MRLSPSDTGPTEETAPLRVAPAEGATFDHPYRSAPMRVINWTGSVLRGWGWRKEIRVDEILESARRQTGLSDWGDESFLEPLALLVRSFEQEARLNPVGRMIVKRLLAHFAANRLRIHEQTTREPGILDQRIRRPLFVVGLPRSGTTLLQWLLSLDPRCRPLLAWESFWPAPITRNGEVVRDRKESMQAVARLTHRCAPHLKSIHAVQADGPEETTFLMANTFATWTFSLMGRVPTYEEWLWNLDAEQGASAYRELHRQLQVLQSQRSGGHWMLKSPLHLPSLDSLLATFPDACIVRTHRDPADAVPSTCSLFAVTRSIYSDAVDARALGEEVAARLAEALARAERVRTFAPNRILDVRFEDLVRDKLGTVRRIYDEFGYEYDEPMEQAITTWLREDGHRPSHRYDLGQFGLTPERLDELFGDYRETYRLGVE